jgi:hypothetical protein
VSSRRPRRLTTAAAGAGGRNLARSLSVADRVTDEARALYVDCDRARVLPRLLRALRQSSLELLVTTREPFA